MSDTATLGTVCSRKNGSHRSGSSMNVIVLNDESDSLPQCPVGYQCLDVLDGLEGHNTSSGLCSLCSSRQSCPEGTIGYLETKDLDNICPAGYYCDPYPNMCLEGTVCWENIQLDCEEIHDKFNDYYGDIFAGSYCTNAAAQIMDCPAGNYCPNSYTKVTCPDGFYCPRKSSKPMFKCALCPEGSEDMSASPLRWIVFLGSLLFLVFFAVLFVIVGRRRLKLLVPPTQDSRRASITSSEDSVNKKSGKSKTKKLSKVKLSSLVRAKRWDDVLRRCETNPEEASLWFSEFDNTGKITTHMTPLHLAITLGAPQEVIKSLRVSYIFSNRHTDGVEVESSESDEETEEKDEEHGVKINDENERMNYHHVSFSIIKFEVTRDGRRQKVLKDLTGTIEGGKLTAIMGESGCGKSSFLNVLGGRAFYGQVSGKVLFNGSMGKNEFIGYVPQHDVLFSELTVMENMIYAGRFRLSKKASTELASLSRQILSKLGLLHVADSIVGDTLNRGISGGEIRRLSIGIELLGRPKVLFCDEPTSGLDASGAFTVISILKDIMSTEGVTICCAIHQPRHSVFDLFDNVLLLAKRGKLIYNGPVNDVVTYFNSIGFKSPLEGENIADWAIDICTGTIKAKGGTEISDIEESDQDDEDSMSVGSHGATLVSFVSSKARNVLRRPITEYDKNLPITYQNRPGCISQMITHIRRNITLLQRGWLTLVIDLFTILLVTGGASLLMGPLEVVDNNYFIRYDPDWEFYMLARATLDQFENGLLRKLFFYAWNVSANFRLYSSVIASASAILCALVAIRPFTEKRLHFFRESSSGYNITSYYLAFNFSSMLVTCAIMTSTALMNYYVFGSLISFESYLLNYLLLGWTASAWGIFIALLVPSKNLVVVIGLFIVLATVCLSGAVAPVEYFDIYSDNTIKQLSSFFSPGRYFIETMVVSEMKCLPSQTGFTVDRDATRFLPQGSSFSILGLAQDDIDVTERSCRGWSWGLFQAFSVGLIIRYASGLLIHLRNRGQLGRDPITKAMRTDIFGCVKFCLCIVVLVLLIVYTRFLILEGLGFQDFVLYNKLGEKIRYLGLGQFMNTRIKDL